MLLDSTVETPSKPCVSELTQLQSTDPESEHAHSPAFASASARPWSISWHSGTGYLVGSSSGIAVSSSSVDDGVFPDCATERSPVRITANVGQRFNITVYEFGYGHPPTRPITTGDRGPLPPVGTDVQSLSLQAASAAGEVECVVISDLDARRRVNICPRARRMRSETFVSTNNTVEVFFKRVSAGTVSGNQLHHVTASRQQSAQHRSLDDRRFLVKFTGEYYYGT